MRKLNYLLILLFLFFLISCSCDINIDDNQDEKDDEIIEDNSLLELYQEFISQNKNYTKTFDEWYYDLKNGIVETNNYKIKINYSKQQYLGFFNKININIFDLNNNNIINNVMFTYKSLDESIAKVNNDGYIIGVQIGHTSVEIENNNLGIFMKCPIEILEEPNINLDVNLGGYEINIISFESQQTFINPYLDVDINLNKVYQQKSLQDIEKKYNCKIKFVTPPYDSTLFDSIKRAQKNNEYLGDIIYTNANYIPSYVNNNLLYDTTMLKIKNNFNLINEINYNDFYYNGHYYGFGDGSFMFNNLYGLVYDNTLLKKYNIDSPINLFNKDNWNYETFVKWAIEAKDKIGYNSIISTDAISIYSGLLNVKGENLYSNDYSLNFCNLYDVNKYIQLLYDNNILSFDYYNVKNNGFTNCTSLMTPFCINYLLMIDEFDDEKSFGFVPFPYPNFMSNYDAYISEYDFNGFLFLNKVNNIDNIYKIFNEYLITSIKYKYIDLEQYNNNLINYLQNHLHLDDDSIELIINLNRYSIISDKYLNFCNNLNNDFIDIIVNKKDFNEEIDELYVNYNSLLNNYLINPHS